MLWDARQMYLTGEGTGVSEELEEVEHELVAKGLAQRLEEEDGPEGNAVRGGETAEFGLDDVTAEKANSGMTIPGMSSAGTVTTDQYTTVGSPSVDVHGDNDTDIVRVDMTGESEVGNRRGSAVSDHASPKKGEATKTTGSGLVFQAFILTFLAEWGDRSQIATIALAAAQNPYGVTLGACIGHSICTGGAVIGGKLLASRITERQVAVSGGILFFVFAFYSWYMGPM